MTVSFLTILVVLETIVILLAVVFFLARRHSKLKKAFDKLLASMSESIFAKLVEEEIDNTVERIQEILPDNQNDIDLADSNEVSEQDHDDNSDDLSEDDKAIKSALTFRSAYLHAEINAYNASEGDPGLFWLYLAENIAELMPTETKAQNEEPDESHSNEFIDEIMQELQAKLDKSTESNLSLQALLDSLLADGHLAPDQISTIKNSQADYHDLSQHVVDLEHKIQNSLNIEITGGHSTDVEEKTLIIEKTQNKVNTETNKLKDIIFDQGNKINNLLKQLKNNTLSIEGDSDLVQQLEALEKSQQETSMCMDVLEMENHRLLEELENLQAGNNNGNNEELTTKITELEKIIESKDRDLEQLNKEFDSIQSEFMAVYEKGKNL